MKTLLRIGTGFLVGAALVAAPARGCAQDGGIDVGAHAPSRSLNTAEGKPFNLADVIGKRPVLLEFWATWCENCRALEPHLLDMQRKYAAQMAFVGIAVPINQTLERVQCYVQAKKYPFPMLWDKDGALAADYDVPATSFVVIIDRSGKVVYTGAGGNQKLESAIKKAL